MAESIAPDEQSNYETFRECLSDPVLRILAKPVENVKTKRKKKPRAHKKKTSKEENDVETPRAEPEPELESTEDADAEDLGDFIDYLSTLIFSNLPETLRTLSHSKFRDSPSLQTTYTLPLTPTTTNKLLSTTSPLALENLSSYALLSATPDPNDIHHFFTPILTSYITSTTAPPPIWSTTRTTECELCHRDWINLTYHHLIPRSTHERVRKRGWHDEDVLNSVAWLCRACHSFVHRIASNEELAREWYTVELLEEREDVQGWVRWVGRVRWKKR